MSNTAQQPESWTATVYRLPLNHEELFKMLAEARKEAKSSLLKEVREAFLEELKQRGKEAEETGDLQKSMLAGYANGVATRILKNMEEVGR